MFSKYKVLISIGIILPVSLLLVKALEKNFTADGNTSLNATKNAVDVNAKLQSRVSNFSNNSTKTEQNLLEPNTGKGGVVVIETDKSANPTNSLNLDSQAENSNAVTKTSSKYSNWRLPWSTGVTARLTQRWHSDGWSKGRSLDFGLPPGTPVVAPVDSTVMKFCNAGNNHLAIRLKSADGQMYSLVHVKSSTVYKNKKYKKGQQIGVIAGDRPWNPCAKSTGPHLHFSLPERNFNIGGYNFSSSVPKFVTPKK